MNLNIERLGQGERIAAGSALALLICMFLSWFNFSYTASNAWESLHYISPILAISIVATLGVAFSEAREMSIGDIPGGLTIFVLGCLSALLILFRLIDPISTPGIEGGSTSGSVEAGAFLGFFAALGIAAGGYVATDGKAIDRLKALLPSGPGAPGGYPPAAPPPPAPVPTPGPAPNAAPPAPASLPSPPVRPPAPESPVGAGPEAEPASTAPAAAAQPEPPAAPDEPEPAAEASPSTEPDSAGPAESAEPPEESSRSVFCEGCGAPLRPHDRFCRKCGHQQATLGS
ncbi:MAG: zinc ribbon domain-containing protein [Chloroflexota bacterium]